MQSIFPLTDHPRLNNNDLKFQKEMKTAIMAKNLKKRLGLRFQATDDLRRHLTLDRKHWVLNISHKTAFLKEHLRLPMDKTSNMSMSETLKFTIVVPKSRRSIPAWFLMGKGILHPFFIWRSAPPAHARTSPKNTFPANRPQIKAPSTKAHLKLLLRSRLSPLRV